jgi:hypothetical protein
MKIKYILIIPFIFLFNKKSYSQNHSFAFIVEPTIATSLIEDKSYRPNPPNITNYYYVGKGSYSFGIEYLLSNNFNSIGLKSGIFFNNFGLKNIIKYDNPSLDKDTVNFHFHTLSIPFEVNWNYKSFDLNFGPTFNYIYNYHVKNSTGEIKNVYGIVDYYIGLKGGITYGYSFSNSLSFKGGVYGQTNYVLKEVFINYGIRLGLNYLL